MTGREDARFRLALATRSLDTASAELAVQRWREAALFGRSAIEHAVKAIIAAFRPVPRSHEPGLLLDEAMADARFPAPLRSRAGRLRPELDAYGLAEHILLSYGDERARIDPWTLVTRSHAERTVRVAEEAAALAGECLTALFP